MRCRCCHRFTHLLTLFKKKNGRGIVLRGGYGARRGFNLVELLIGAAIFLVIATSIYGAYNAVIQVISASRAKIIAMDLANERFELIRNLPYDDVGISGSIPNGILAHVESFSRSGFDFIATTTIRNIDDPFDGTIGGSPNDLSPADSRLVEIEIGCQLCKNFPPLFVNSRIAPKNLETASTNGALFVRVFDANGQPVEGASVHIENTQASPDITIDDVTNTSGMLQIVDAPPGVNAYEITVTKSGYTTDRTYTPGDAANPNPLMPHATVVIQQVTQVSFVIDRASTMNISSMSNTCVAVGGVDFSIQGTKLIGTTPDVLKFDQTTVTNGSGDKTLSGLEWDTYPITLTDATYDLIGTNPIFPITLPQDTNQDVKLIVAAKDPSTLLVVVKDTSTGLPLENATVRLERSGYDETQVTERGFVTQTDWSGGGGQATSSDPAQYFDSTNVETSGPAGEVKLNGSFGVYDASGSLESSTFDIGSASNFHQLFWLPADQPVDTGADSVKMQIASNNDAATWNFLGPDGTGATYYSSPTSDIGSAHAGTRYVRYKLFLSTASSTLTPNVSDVSATYSSQCVPPGQVAFTGLANGTYTLTVSRSGYQDYNAQVSVDSSWQQEEVSMLPE